MANVAERWQVRAGGERVEGADGHQDYVCGAALRACRAVFDALAVKWVIATVRTELLDQGTGHTSPRLVLSILAPRQSIARINYRAVDPSEAMANFVSRMKFTRGAGLAPIECFTVSDLPVSDV